MSLQEMKEVVGTLLFGGALISIAISYSLYLFAKVTYKIAHKNK